MELRSAVLTQRTPKSRHATASLHVARSRNAASTTFGGGRKRAAAKPRALHGAGQHHAARCGLPQAPCSRAQTARRFTASARCARHGEDPRRTRRYGAARISSVAPTSVASLQRCTVQPAPRGSASAAPFSSAVPTWLAPLRRRASQRHRRFDVAKHQFRIDAHHAIADPRARHPRAIRALAPRVILAVHFDPRAARRARRVSDEAPRERHLPMKAHAELPNG